MSKSGEFYLGISALHHDSTVAVIDSNGVILGISQEERRTKIKNDKSWPQISIDLYQKEFPEAKIGFYEKPWLKFSRQIIYEPNNFKKYWANAVKPSGINSLRHHQSHALAATATAPFDHGMYLIVDAIGEWNSTTWGSFDQQSMPKQLGKINYPSSIGLLYSAFTRWLGLKPNEDEYIVMGASAYGEPKFVNKIYNDFIHEYINGTFSLTKNIHRGIESYYGHQVNLNDWFDWAASIQDVCELLMLNLVDNVERINYQLGFEEFNLVLGGGVALNCVCNAELLRDINIHNFWILPSPGDGGSALGAAAYAAGLFKLKWDHPFLGSSIDHSIPSNETIDKAVQRLENGEIIGWIQGREEFGPRALGHRSLLADPRSDKVKDKMNLIKNRQTYRPFAPAVLEEEAIKYFDMPGKVENHRYMQLTSIVRNPADLPAICHVDNSTRVQTVPNNNDPFRILLEKWKEKTGCSVLMNTSFNVKGQPLISEKSDAIAMLNTVDAIYIGNKDYT